MSDPTSRQRAVRFIIRSRTDRQKFFPSTLFSEPAWDMLLTLYEAAIEQRSLSVSKLAKAASVELSTAARWVSALEGQGLVTVRSARGVQSIALSANGWLAMDSYFENMSSGMI